MKSVALAVVLVLGVLVVACQADSNCHWGPSYWCKDGATAEECGSTQYCQDNVWKKPVSMVSKPQGIECDLCQIIAKFIVKELEDNKTEAQVEAAVMDLCSSLGPLASSCKDFVNSTFDELWDAIVNDGGDKACEVLGLCTSSKPAVPRPLKKTMPGECFVCKEVAKEILKLVESNSTEALAKVEIKKVCVYLGGFAPECRLFIHAFFDEMWDAAKKAVGDPEAICKEIKACNSSRLAHTTTFMAKPKVPQAGICDICKLVVNFIKPYVDSNSTETEVKDALEGLCKLLPGNYSSECSGLVDQYFDLIWTILKSEVDSGDACVLLELCNKTQAVVFAKSQPRLQAPQDMKCEVCTLAVGFIKPYVDSAATETEVKAAVRTLCSLLPGDYKSECNDTVNQYFDAIWDLLKQEVDSGEVCKQLGLCSASLKKKPVGGSDMCEACQMVVKYLKDIVDNSATEAEAKALVEAVCDEAGPLKDECKGVVDSYFPMLWKLLQSYVDDDQICAEIKLCANMSTRFLQSAVVEVQKAPLQKVGGGVFCMVCELVMKELTSMLDTNATEQAIEAALDKVCSALPSSFKEDCTHFVDKYAPEIIKLIVSGVAGKAVCTALGLCLGEQEQLVAVQGTEECVLCKTVVGLAKTLIASKSAETKVDEVIEKLCVLVPSGIRDECTSFIEKYGPELIQLVEKEIDPETICADIKLCTKTSGARLTAMKY